MAKSVDMLSELRTRCREAQRQPPEETIEEGKLVSLSGTAASAEEGSIGLRIHDGETLTILEKDIVKVERDESRSDGFHVFVKPDSELLHTRTRVVSPGEMAGVRRRPQLAGQRLRRSPFFWFEDCRDLCDQIEASCLAGLHEPQTVDEIPGFIRDVNRCRDLGFGCAGICADLLFSEAIARSSAQRGRS